MLAFIRWSGKSERLHQHTEQSGQRLLAIQLGAGCGWIQGHQVQFELSFGWTVADSLPEQRTQYVSVSEEDMLVNKPALATISTIGLRQKRTPYTAELQLLHTSYHINPFSERA